MAKDTFEVENGFRAGGTTFKKGDQAPIRYRTQLEQAERPVDPANPIQAAPPNFGQPVIPHIFTFSGIASTLSRSYRSHDEAIRDSVHNAHVMLNDPMVAGPLFARQRMVSLLNWTIESEDDKDPHLKAAADELKKIVSKTRRFAEYRRALSEAIWYGRYAVMNKYGVAKKKVNGKRLNYYYIKDWTPVSGDKLVFRYDDGIKTYDPDGVGIKVSPAHITKDIIAGDRPIEYFAEGTAVFLERWERDRVVVHKHMIRDGEYEDPLMGSQVHGVGLRNFLYWTWYQKQEAMAQLVEIIELTSRGFTVYYYPSGNEQYRQKLEEVAKAQAHTNVIMMPVDADPGMPDPIQNIPPNNGGVQVLREIIDDFYGDIITRFILGQTLSSKSSATGLGSGVADLHHDSLKQIVKYDATNLEETITREMLTPLKNWNLPQYRDHEFNFRIQTESNIPREELEALQQAWSMGAKIKTSDLMDKIGASIPTEDDDVVYNPMVVQAIEGADQGMGMPGMPGMGGMPPEGGDGLPPDDGGGGDPELPPDDGQPGIVLPEQQDPEQAQKDDRQAKFGPILNRKADSNERKAYAKKKYAQQGELFGGEGRVNTSRRPRGLQPMSGRPATQAMAKEMGWSYNLGDYKQIDGQQYQLLATKDPTKPRWHKVDTQIGQKDLFGGQDDEPDTTVSKPAEKVTREGDQVQTPDGIGRVVDIHDEHDAIEVELDDGNIHLYEPSELSQTEPEPEEEPPAEAAEPVAHKPKKTGYKEYEYRGYTIEAYTTELGNRVKHWNITPPGDMHPSDAANTLKQAIEDIDRYMQSDEGNRQALLQEAEAINAGKDRGELPAEEVVDLFQNDDGIHSIDDAYDTLMYREFGEGLEPEEAVEREPIDPKLYQKLPVETYSVEGPYKLKGGEVINVPPMVGDDGQEIKLWRMGGLKPIPFGRNNSLEASIHPDEYPKPNHDRQRIIVACGLGVDSFAMLVAMKEKGVRPDVIHWADTGSERHQTYQAFNVLQKWCKDNDFPPIVAVRRRCPQAGHLSLIHQNWRTEQAPSARMGANHSCSESWKLQPQRNYDRNLPWLWDYNKPVTMIGFDADEVEGSTRRGLKDSQPKAVEMIGFDAEEVGKRKSGNASYAVESRTDKDSNAAYETRFPLAEWGLDRQDCVDMIREENLPVPGKSACIHCPFSKKCELHEMKASGELDGVIALERRFNAAQQQRRTEHAANLVQLETEFNGQTDKELAAQIKDLKARKDELEADDKQQLTALVGLAKARNRNFNTGLDRAGRHMENLAAEPMQETDAQKVGLRADPMPDPEFIGEGPPEPPMLDDDEPYEAFPDDDPAADPAPRTFEQQVKQIGSYGEFKQLYNETLDRMMNYPTDQAGSLVMSEQMGLLADTYPEYADRIDDELAPEPAKDTTQRGMFGEDYEPETYTDEEYKDLTGEDRTAKAPTPQKQEYQDSFFDTGQKRDIEGQELLFEDADGVDRPAPAKPATQYDPAKFITIAADDITKLRKPDVYRVIDSAPIDAMEMLAQYIKDNRPDLADEVDEVMQEIAEE